MNPKLGLHDSGELVLTNTEYADANLYRAIRDGRWHKKGSYWLYPFSCIKMKKIKTVFPNVEITDELRTIWKREIAKLKDLHHLKQQKDIDFNILNMKTKPFKHQKVGVKFMLMLDRCMNLDELGNGKSWQALATAIQRKNNNEVEKCLIICPASTKFAVWEKEIKQHTHEKYLILTGSVKERIIIYKKFATEDYLFLVINYELVRKDIQTLSESLKFDMVICDESVKLKTPKAQQTKATKKIPARFKIALSGYPIANRCEDIWSQVDWIQPGYLGRTYWSFLDKYTYSGPFNEIAGYKNIDELRKKLQHLFIRRLKKDTLDLPPKIFETREIELNAKERRAYNSMKKEMIVRIEQMNEADIIAQANEILTQMIRLSQIADGFITDKNLRKPEWFDSSKIRILDEIVDEVTTAGNKIVIWSRFVPMVMKLKDRYNAPYISGHVPLEERAKNVERFQTDPKTNIFIGQVQSGGMGITLHAASTEVFVDKAFISPSNIIQAIDRLHRIGQKNPVTIISLIATKTVDVRWDKLIEKKRLMSDKILGDTEQFRLDKEAFVLRFHWLGQ